MRKFGSPASCLKAESLIMEHPVRINSFKLLHDATAPKTESLISFVAIKEKSMRSKSVFDFATSSANRSL